MSEINRLINGVNSGVPCANAALLEFVYQDLRRLASTYLANEQPGHSLQPTALVNETYLRLFGVRPRDTETAESGFQNQRHFFGAAAEAMRRILVESARRKNRLKRSGTFQRVLKDPDQIAEPEMADELLALDEALTALTGVDTQAADLVRLRFFAGLTVSDAARQLGISSRTADSKWAYARAWLLAEMSPDE